MQIRFRKILVKILKYTGIGIVSILVLMFLLPYLFPTFVSNKIKQWANQSIEAELNFSKARLSFFNHFPSLTLTLYDISLKGSAPFKQDTLFAGKEVALGVNLLSIFSKTIRIDEIYLTKGKLNILVNEKGLPNYNVYASTTSSPANNNSDTGSAALKLDRIQIDECQLTYDDRSIPMRMSARRLDYLGKGDLSKAIFDLKSTIGMQGFTISHDNRTYLENKNLNAKLITQINTSSLALVFEKNDLMINQLPVLFKGKFDFLKDGYDMDFSLTTKPTAFKHLFTALPPEAVSWLDKTTVKGEIAMDASLKGNYIASKKIAPDLNFNMRIVDGSIAAKNITEPVEKIFLSFHFAMPHLDMESITVKMDSLHASMGKDEISAKLESKGLTNPFISGRVDAHADIEKWYKTMALTNSIDVRGLLHAKGNFNGTYRPQAKQFPAADLSLQLKDGYLKTDYYPTPLTNLQVNVDVLNKKGTTGDLKINVKPISLDFEGKPFVITSNLQNFDNLSYQVNSKGVLNVGRIYKLFAVKGYDVESMIETNFTLQGNQADAAAGRYDKLHNKGTFTLRSTKLSSASFPQPFFIQSGIFRFNDDKIVADKIQMRYGSIAATLNGYLGNIINYALKDNAVLEGKLDLHTKHLVIDELMAFAAVDSTKTVPAKTAGASSGVVVIPSNLDMQFNVNADKISYNGLDLQNCQSVTTVQRGKISISKAAFTLIGSPVNMTASYASLSQRRALFDYHITAADFDIQKAYKEIRLFREMATAAGKASGNASLDYQLSGMLNEDMYPIYPTLKGGGVLSLKKIKVYGLKLFSAISEKTNKDKIANPDLSKVDIKTKIANNIITIERFKLRVAGFRPRFEGQVSFDGRLNLRARLGLPPFGIIGIPLTVTGTQAKPVVKIKRGKASDTLQETDADEEDKKEAAEAAAREAAEQKKTNGN